MKLSFGFTPCPNDAFAFHALVHGLVAAPFEVEPVLLDIEELNRRSARGELELTKLSFGAAAAAGDRYRLLRSGAALGRGVGPLVVAREPGSLDEAAGGRIAVPGPGDDGVPAPPARRARARRRRRAPLRRDPRRGRRGRGRRGADHPREPLHVPRPRSRRGRRSRRVVGGRDRAARSAGRDLRAHRPRAGLVEAAEAAIRASVEYAFAHPEASRDYVRSLAQEMSDEVCARAHRALREREQRRHRRRGARRDRAAARSRRSRCLDSPREPGRRPLRRPHADRPLRRRACGRPPRRSRGARDQRGGRARRRSARSRSRTSGSAPRTRPARTTATSRGWRRCSRGFPSRSAGVTVNRLCASGLAAVVGACHAVIAGDGDLFVAGGEESMTPRAVRHAEGGEAVRARRPAAVRHDARLALHESEARRAVPAGVDGRDGRERRRAVGRLARGSGRVRARVAAALGGRRRGGPLRRRARPGRRRDARRASAAGHDAREARRAQARVPRGRHRHRRQRVRHQRRRRRARDRVGGEGARARRRAARHVRRQRGRGRRPARDGRRPDPGRAEGARAERRRASPTSTSSS